MARASSPRRPSTSRSSTSSATTAPSNRDEADALFKRTLPYLAWAHQHIDISIHFYKLYSRRRGLFTTSRARQPILPFDAYHRRVANEIIDEMIEFEDGLG